jgi:hypothetical protein
MNRSLIACALALLLLAGAWTVGAASANYSGTWVLDKAKSQGLPPQWESIESYTMQVTQDEKQLTVQNKFVGGNRAGGGQGAASGQDRPRRDDGGVGQGGGRRAGGAGGQGGGRGGPGMRMPISTYKLDGTETKMESTGGRGGAVTLKAQWKDGGNALELTNTRSVNLQGNETTRTTTERWELAEGGKVLKVKHTVDGGQRTQESTLVFNKQ